MTSKEIHKAIEKEEIVWGCRFHPTKWFHEVGCPHRDWTIKDLRYALEHAKKSKQVFDRIKKEESIYPGR